MSERGIDILTMMVIITRIMPKYAIMQKILLLILLLYMCSSAVNATASLCVHGAHHYTSGDRKKKT